MVIDFEKIAEAHLEGFKGGQGKLDTRNYVDDKVKIMYSTLRPGASTGLHTHEGNCEIIYVVSGTATFHYDDTVEEVRQGQVHYCPMNHAHTWRTSPTMIWCISPLCQSIINILEVSGESFCIPLIFLKRNRKLKVQLGNL